MLLYPISLYDKDPNPVLLFLIYYTLTNLPAFSSP